MIIMNFHNNFIYHFKRKIVNIEQGILTIFKYFQIFYTMYELIMSIYHYNVKVILNSVHYLGIES